MVLATDALDTLDLSDSFNLLRSRSYSEIALIELTKRSAIKKTLELALIAPSARLYHMGILLSLVLQLGKKSLFVTDNCAKLKQLVYKFYTND